MKINANLIKVGNILKHKDKALQVLNTNVIKPGKGGAFIQVEMKDIQSGVKFNERWRTSDTVEKISVHEKEVTFLYIENEIITFMNNENFEQITCPSNVSCFLGPSKRCSLRGLVVINFYRFLQLIIIAALISSTHGFFLL